MRITVITVIAGALYGLLTVASLVAATPSLADRGGCPNPAAANGALHANDNSAHGGAKQTERDCLQSTPGVTASPTPPATPSPTPSPTASPTASPSPSPTLSPSPSPTSSPSPTPTPGPTADLEALSALFLSPPASATTGIPFFISGAARVRNLGPTDNVAGDLTLLLSVPADCSAGTPLSLNIHLATMPISMISFSSGGWMVMCLQPGSHEFGLTASVALSSPLITDPNPVNNSATAVPALVDVSP